MRLTQKQRIQLEIIDIDHDLQQLVVRYPQSKFTVDRMRDALANCVSLLDGTELRQFCCGLRCGDGGIGGLE